LLKHHDEQQTNGEDELNVRNSSLSGLE